MLRYKREVILAIDNTRCFTQILRSTAGRDTEWRFGYYGNGFSIRAISLIDWNVAQRPVGGWLYYFILSLF